MMTFAFLIYGVITLGVFINFAEDYSIFHSVLAALLWPFVLGMTIGERLKKEMK